MAAMAAALAANSTMSSDKAEMRLYLDRLKSMVPQCPKNRKVSRQELIEHVINYISDLEDTLQSDSDSDSPPASPTIVIVTVADVLMQLHPNQLLDEDVQTNSLDKDWPEGIQGQDNKDTANENLNFSYDYTFAC
ncbi:DNA-binding protein inhibitor ID-4-like [Penaeus japonicus]|uniref:DNA-binding protein inhibitor ID-4-like n=1 Tax=Penaeus japonicus TaxID=27405 RepID=UPI001C70DD52|nr:DNA-binding protein inhibitor ID-4-like [Penaeus japonicus]